jgi:hypothetical protein
MGDRKVYRFTLQWADDTAEKKQAGDLLKKLGNQKSVFIVHAISDYIARHLSEYVTAQLNLAQRDFRPRTVINREAAKPRTTKKKRAEARLSENAETISNKTEPDISEKQAEAPAADEADIDAMLDNLDLF